MRRALVIATLVGSMLLGLFVVGGGVRAQGTTPMAGHPLIGTWIVTDPTGSPSVISFTADGTVTEIQADGGIGLGTWMATGANTAAFTFVILLSGPDFTASVQINVSVTIDASGNSGAAPYSLTVVLPDGTVVASDTGAVTVVRMPVQPLSAAGMPMAGYPTWNPDQNGGGTPVATPAS